MKIKMLENFAGYSAGSTTDMADGVAQEFIKLHKAAKVDDSPTASKWVKALVDIPNLNKKSGEQFLIEDDQVRADLVVSKMASHCADPTQPVIDRVMNEFSEELTKRINESVTNAFADTVSKSKTALANKPFLPAQPKEPEGFGGFKAADEYWHAVKSAGLGGGVDKRLLGGGNIVDKAPQGLNTLTGEEGGFLVPPAISNRILELAFAEGNLMRMTDFETITAASMEFNAVKDASRATGSRRGGMQAYWVDQAAQYTRSKPEFRRIMMKPNKLAVLCYVTDEQLADTQMFATASKIEQYAAEEIRWMVDDAILNGTGTGSPKGIIDDPSAVVVTPETGQAADTIRFENIVKMMARLLRVGGSPTWLANIDTLPQLASLAFPSSNIPLLLNVSTGAPSAGQAMQGTLFGVPIKFVEQAKTIGTKGDLILADLAAYKMCARGSINSAMSIHVRFEYGETAFRFDFRIDGKSWLDSTITPANGSSTLGPYVMLHDR